jgi:hypothetical protein
VAHYVGHRVYRDVNDPDCLRVDSLDARLRTAGHGLAPRGLTEGRPARPVCVAFGPDERTLAGAHTLFSEHRATSISWNSGPFFAWVRKAGGVTVLDHGESTHVRGHEVHVYAAQPEGVELVRAVAAVELVTWGRLSGVSLKASTVGPVAREVRESARVGRRAPWSSTLGDALVAALLDLLRRDRLQITVASGPVPLYAFDEIRELVVMEWAHRLAGAHPLSLPAALLSGLIHDRDIDLSIDWRDSDRVPLRTVRALRYDSIAADSVQSLSWGLSGGHTGRAATPA